MKHLLFLALYLGLCAGSTPRSDLPVGFVYLDKVVPSIEVDPRYYSTDNFVGERIRSYQSNRCITTVDLANALKDVQLEFADKGLRLKVFDAYRPQSAVDHFVAWAKDLDDTLMKSKYYPDVPKSSLFTEGYIADKSGHSRGGTVDLTLVYTEGKNRGLEMDMGSSWDFFGPKSWPSSNEVSLAQKANRMVLQSTMIDHGFKPLKEEWWHFTLQKEPFPDTYFDFPVE